MSKNPENQNISIYQSNDGQISFNVNIFEETVWLTQKQMAELFDRDRKTITRHISNIFKEGELQEREVCSYFEHTTRHGAIKDKTQIINVKYYNLDVILSVGYRVKSQRGMQFRLWSNKVLKQYLTNGYAVNETRVKSILKEYIIELKSELKLDFKDDIQILYQKILEISNKPINIYNQISLTTSELENKIIDYLDKLIIKTKTDQKLKTQLETIKDEITKTPKDKKKIKNFFSELGNDKSNLNKTIQGIGISKKIITELVKLGEKLKDLVF